MHLKKFFASAFSVLAVLSISVQAAPDTVLINGQGIGITLNSGGVMVTDMSEIETSTGKEESPAQRGGIRKGDIITKIDGADVNCISALHEALSRIENRAVMVELYRGDSKITLRVKPIADKDGKYRLGLWARDAAAGIGTLTFYDPETGNFGALGHGITENTTGTLLRIEDGEVLTSTIVAIQKGKKGQPGELQGIFGEDDKPIGYVERNTNCGIFGKMELPQTEMAKTQSIKVGGSRDVREGKAYILANTEGKNVEKFEIEICSIPVFSSDKTKGMVIRITDKKLLQKTGGIVRGMSGCPIVQSGRLVGAVTHVFVNDPTKGYGIFIEDMLSAMEN